jgi:hypothetical protein
MGGRAHRCSSDWHCCSLALTFVPLEPPEPVDDGPLLHAASRTGAAVAMTAVAVRAADGHSRGRRRTTRVLSFIMPSFGVGSRLRPVAGAYRD